MQVRKMKNSFSPSAGALHAFIIAIAFFFTALTVAESLPPYHYISSTLNGKASHAGDDQSHMYTQKGAKEEEAGKEELNQRGSSLPDCSHACGPCFPCRRVIVSFKCSTEPCPIVYRCMCKGKYYPVPTSH